MTLVPYREAGRPRARTLDQAQVVQAALELLDEAGLDQLTMRRLAERLGVKAASLYRHVRDKDDLLVLLADEICGRIPAPPSTGSWKHRLVQMTRSVRAGLLAHRDGARVLAETRPVGPRRMRLIEGALRILRSAGLSRLEAARVAHHLNNFITESAADEARYAAAAAAMGVSRRKLLADARRYFRSLPASDFPTLVELAEELVRDDPKGLFEFGLQVWLRTVEELAGRRS